jgi:ectoine hydroxylase-related dioxygenase (phytanoyl-CoA dioxygenase family)
VIPGSHRVGDHFSDQLEREVKKSDESWGIPGSQVPGIALETKPGDVLVFTHAIKHSAWGGSTRRRMFTMNCCQRYPDDKLPALRDYLAGGSRFLIERSYDNTVVRTASPERMIHLEQVLANDGHLAELSAKRRLEMAEPARG